LKTVIFFLWEKPFLFGENLGGCLLPSLSHVSAFLGWRIMFGLSAVPAALQLVGMLFLPESPRWLMMKGREAQAHQVLGSLRNATTSDIDVCS
jgi:hypothetical protein